MFSFLGEELKVWSTFPGAPLGWSCEVATLCGAVLSPVLATLSWHSRFAARPASFVTCLAPWASVVATFLGGPPGLFSSRYSDLNLWI